MTSDCSTHSILSQNVTITYGVIYSLLFVIVSIYSFNFLMKYDKKFFNSSSIKKLKIWAFDVWKRRRCYIPIVVHIFDQITDISVAIQFYILAQQQNDKESCGGLNMWYLFILTILSILIYRLVSSYLIYESTKSIQRFFSQLLDLELFRALYINYLCNKNEPCDPQRWITALEASLESSPQALIQIIYLVKTDTFNSSYLVLISLISSLWSIVSKLVSDDKVIVIGKAQNANFKFRKRMICDVLILLLLIPILFVLGAIFGVLFGVLCIICCPCYICWCMNIFDASNIEDIFNNIKMRLYEVWEKLESFVTKHTEWISLLYVARVLWRIFDVTSHLLLMALIWIVIGGTTLTIKVFVEIFSLLIICIVTKQWEILFAVIALVISTTTDRLRAISIGIGAYRTCTNIMFMILISIWLYIDFECWRCTDYQERQLLVDNVYVFTIFIYSWIAVILSPICLSFLIIYAAIKYKTSTSRQLEKMIISNNYDGILEIQLYSSKYSVYDTQNKKTLLMLAIQQQKPVIVSFIVNQIDQCDERDEKGLNILDHYIKSDYTDYQRMTNNLIKIFKKHPNIRSTKGITIFLLGCIYGDLKFIQKLVDLDANIVNDKTNDNVNGATFAKLFGHENITNYLEETYNIHPDVDGMGNILDYFVETDLMTSNALFCIYKHDPTLRSIKTHYTVFLTACSYGYLQLIKQLIDSDKNVLEDKMYGSNAADIAHRQMQKDVLEHLSQIYNITPSNQSNTKHVKLVLLGISGSGKSTFLKQMQLIYYGPMENEKLKDSVQYIRQNILEDIYHLAIQNEILKKTHPECQLNQQSQEICTGIASLKFDELKATELTPEFAKNILILWNDKGLQETYNICKCSHIMDNTPYFFDHINRISDAQYICNGATSEDYLRVKHRTTGIIVSEIDVNAESTGSNWKFIVVDVGGQNRWNDVFRCCTDIATIIYLMPLSAYDQTLLEDHTQNCYDAALDVFARTMKHEALTVTDVIVFLSKNDLFIEKIKEVPFSVFDSEFNKERVHDGNAVKEYLNEEFKKRFYVYDRRVDQNNANLVFAYIKNIQLSFPSNNNYYNIPNNVRYTILSYYYSDEIKPKNSSRRIHFHVTSLWNTNQMQTVMGLIQFETIRKMMRVGMLM